MASTSSQALADLATPRTPLITGTDPEAKRAEIRQYFHDTFDAYEKLFETLKGQEAFVTRADPLRHPLIFYYGHTAVFFINKLVLGKYLPQRLDAALERQCAIGVDEMSWDDLNSAHYEWPHHEAVQAYRDKAREQIGQLIQTAPLTLPIQWDSVFWVILMGIEHERIHLETSSVLIRQLPLELLDADHPTWKPTIEDGPAPQNALLDVPAGAVVQGRSGAGKFYSWDNEYGRLQTEVTAFKASQYLVSNAEFKEFVDDGGYRTQQWWTPEGWQWAEYDDHRMPRFWRKDEQGHYHLRLMLEEIEMPWSWPVETNYLEAKAFCNWKAARTGKPVRLPTEAEWYRLLDFTATPDVDAWGDKAPGNLNLEYTPSSVPVDKFAFGQGFYDVLGNVWQHTETPIAGFPGFEVHPLYDDFSTPTFDTKHNLIKGGSWISTGNEVTRDSRYAFRRHFYQHAGFRYIESDVPVVINDDRYETDADVVPYMESHYGPEEPAQGNYAEKLAQFCLDWMSQRKRHRAVEVGCRVGRTTFELSAGFDSVLGLDPTARNLRIGVEMVDKGYTQWEIPREGQLKHFRQAHLKDLGLDHLRQKVEFMQADLANMKRLYTGYDLILINGLLERSYHPARFLESVHERLNQGGLLIIATSEDWDEAHTKVENWLGGFKDATGENVTTMDTLQRLLNPRFDLLESGVTLAHELRHHDRRFETLLMHLSVWSLR